GVVTERRCTHPDATRWSYPPAADPAAPVQVHFGSPGWVNSHRLVAFGREKKMAMVGRYDGLLNAGGGELADRSRQIVDYCIHHLPGLEGETGLARVVDLLRAHDDELGTF